MVGILVSFWDDLFSGAMLVSGRVNVIVHEKSCSKKHASENGWLEDCSPFDMGNVSMLNFGSVTFH